MEFTVPATERDARGVSALELIILHCKNQKLFFCPTFQDQFTLQIVVPLLDAV